MEKANAEKFLKLYGKSVAVSDAALRDIQLRFDFLLLAGRVANGDIPANYKHRILANAFYCCADWRSAIARAWVPVVLQEEVLFSNLKTNASVFGQVQDRKSKQLFKLTA